MHHEKYRQSEDCCTRNNRVLIKERGGWRRTYFAHKIQSSKSVFKEAVSVVPSVATDDSVSKPKH